MFLPCFLLARCSQWLLDYDLNAPSAGGECIVSIIRSNATSSRTSYRSRRLLFVMETTGSAGGFNCIILKTGAEASHSAPDCSADSAWEGPSTSFSRRCFLCVRRRRSPSCRDRRPCRFHRRRRSPFRWWPDG